MKIINPEWINLAKGYQAAREFEQQALKNWDAKWAQSVEFARQQGVKRASALIQAQIANEKRALRLILVALAVFIMVIFAINYLIDQFPGLHWILSSARVFNILQALVTILPIAEKVLNISALSSTKPEPEELQTALEITDQWWEKVSHTNLALPTNIAELGDFNLLKYFSENLPDEYLALSHPLIKQGLGIDVLLLGPTGIWLFEVKHWGGRVTCHNGVWQRELAPGEEQDDPAQAFDAEWLNERATVEKTLNLRLARNANFGALLRGGLVFTHPNIQLEIDASSKAQYGTPPEWLGRIHAAGKMAQFSTEVQLLVLDTLLDYALSLSGARPVVKSAVELAKLVYGDTLDNLRQYVLRQVRSKIAEKG